MKNRNTQLKDLMRAAKVSDADLFFQIAVGFEDGIGTTRNGKIAHIFYKKAALLGHPSAAYNLGLTFEKRSQYRQAFRYYKIAADSGDAEAINSVGWYFFYGKGVRKNLKEALKYYKKAARKKYVSAIYNVGHSFLFGYGTKKSVAHALSLFKIAASKSHVKSLYYLGWIFSGGEGAEFKNIPKARAALKKAMKLGDRDAKQLLKTLPR